MIGTPDTAGGLVARLPPTAKLAALLALSVLLFATASPAILLVLSGFVLATTLLLCRPALLLWLRAWALLLTIAIVVVWTALATGPEAALVALLRLGTLSLFATVITTTTTAGQFIDTITRLARPLERLGLANARDIGLAIGLVLRFVPEVHGRYRAVLEAHRARGLRLRFSTVIVPMIVSTILSADEIASAIDARGIRANPDDRN